MVGLECTDKPVDVSRVNLTYYSDLYLPPKDYSSCDPIPPEWMDAVPRRIEGKHKAMQIV